MHQVCQVVFFEKKILNTDLKHANSKPLSFDENGQLHSDSRLEDELLNNQFCSIFTSEDTKNIPKLERVVRKRARKQPSVIASRPFQI